MMLSPDKQAGVNSADLIANGKVTQIGGMCEELVNRSEAGKGKKVVCRS